MTVYREDTFADLHRQLLTLYREVEDGGDVTSVRFRLRAIREDLPAGGAGETPDGEAAWACFQRYLKLIALRMPDPALVSDLFLDGAGSDNAHDASEAPLVPEVPGPLRIAVSGIGRSGTTMVYQQLAKLLRLDGRDVNYRYEPYLWNIRTPDTASNSFDMSQLSQFGLYTHTGTPLLLDGPDPLHDRFLDMLFDGSSDAFADRPPDACLTKVIRGSGRLESYLRRYPDLKIVACLRNAYDTLNSSLGMFSFFGEEFHADDRPRFREAVRARGLAADYLSMEAPRSIEWYAAWWRVFTEETLAIAARYPDNVFLFCHETFQRNPAATFEALQEFLGVHNEGIHMGLSRPAGPSIKATSLTMRDLSRLAPEHAFYEEDVLAPLLGQDGAEKLREKVITRYTSGKFSLPLAGSDPGRKVPIQLRDMRLKGAITPFGRVLNGARTPIDLPALVDQFTDADDAPALVNNPEALKQGLTFGAVIIGHNNSGTIVDAVLSCLNQTLPYDRIVVVDDKSHDDSREKLAVLAEMYSTLTILPLPCSLGPSGARHMGIMQLDTDYWTQLDGDDLFWPGKHEAEVRTIAGDRGVVAFSDILLVQPRTNTVQSVKAYDRLDGEETFLRLLSRTRQIPRDMTLSRAAYDRAGGYNLLSHLYEDWDFKLRLAAVDGVRWRRSDARAGTVYNRLLPGLSGAHPSRHARALLLAFFRALKHQTPPPPAERMLASFDAAIHPFGERRVSMSARRFLKAALQSGQSDFTQMATLLSSRRINALDNAGLTEIFNARAEALAGDTQITRAMA